MKHNLNLLQLVCLSCACIAGTVGAMDPPPRVPDPKDYFTPVQFNQVSISPGGTQVAVLVHGDSNLVALIALDTRTLRPLTDPKQHNIRGYWWKTDDLILMLSREKSGELLFFTHDLRANTFRPLDALNTGRSRYGVGIADMLLDDPDSILVTVRSKKGRDLARVNVRTGAMTVVAKNPGSVYAWLTARDGKPVAGLGDQDGQRYLLWRRHEGDSWERRELGPDGGPGLAPLAVDRDGRRLIACEFAAHGTGRIVRYDPADDSRELIFQSNEADPDDLLFVDDVQAFGLTYEVDRPKYFFFDPNEALLHETLQKLLPDTDNRLVSVSRDGNRRIILAAGDRDPGCYYLLDQAAGTLSRFVAQRAEIDPLALRPSRYFRFSSRDGLPMSGRVVLPSASGSKPPLILVVGPSINSRRTYFAFDGLAQYLASRGYATAGINVRGTNGFGVDHVRAGALAGASGMPGDLIDGARWLIDQGLVDGRRVAIWSYSWGGLIAVQAIRQEPALRAWINFSMPLDTSGITEDDAVVLSAEKDQLIAAAGGRRALARYQRAIDPLPLIKALQVPTFLYYPRTEDNTIVQDGRRVASVLERRNIAHVLVPARHGTLLPEDAAEAVEVYDKAVCFLQEHLADAGPPDSAK